MKRKRELTKKEIILAGCLTYRARKAQFTHAPPAEQTTYQGQRKCVLCKTGSTFGRCVGHKGDPYTWKQRCRMGLAHFRCPTGGCVSMCRECFKFSVWHVEHKFTVLLLLQLWQPELTHNVWKLIEEYTWAC